MTKKQLIQAILDASDIHHNIRVDYGRMPDKLDEHQLDLCVDDSLRWFIEELEEHEYNDKGNRNLCGCREKKPSNVSKSGVCEEHDLWHFYQHGRTGATLYWDKYYKSTNTGFYFSYLDVELEDMPPEELQQMLTELEWFNEMVETRLMPGFYARCHDESKRQEATKEAQEVSEKATGELERIGAYQKDDHGDIWYFSRDWKGLDIWEVMLCATNNYDSWHDREGLEHRILMAFDASYSKDGIHPETKKTEKEKLKRKLLSIMPLLLDHEAESFLE